MYIMSLAQCSTVFLAACGTNTSRVAGSANWTPSAIHKIQHIVVIMQENRSFDSYFGTYPGVDGIPMNDGSPSVCVPDPKSGRCIKPYPDHQDVNGGGPHGTANAVADIAGGKMSGFIVHAQAGRRGCTDPTNPVCTNAAVPDVMGYHDGSDIPNYSAWDDWGGFYNHVVPPKVDGNGYGLRMPGLVISPYAKQSFIDHQTLSFDAYDKFIEDDFLGGQRLDPKTDGRPNRRPDVRENEPVLGNLLQDFNFDQAPRPPLILPISPPTQLTPPGG